MLWIIRACGSCLGRAARLAAHCIGISNVDTCRRQAPAARRARALPTALLLAAIAAVTAVNTQASATTVPGLCDSADVVANALSAVVNITVVKVLRTKDTTPGDASNEHIAVFVGSGVAIDPSGIIVTNKHVIQNAALIHVIFHDQVEAPARLIAASALEDLALLKVNVPTPLPTLQFGNSDALQVGQEVMAVGNPLGLGTSVSTGVVSGLHRNLMRTLVDDFIQTDASINPGNSGGPLLDCSGKIVGIDTALISNNPSLGSIGLGFAMPSDDVKFVTNKLRNPDKDPPNWIGVNLQDLTWELAGIFARPDMTGAIVTGVDPESPAAQAALVPGDIIMGAEGQELPDARAILRAIVVQPAGTPIPLSVWRDGKIVGLTVRGQPWPHMTALRSDVLASAAAVARAQAQGLGLGLHLAAITPADRQRFSLGNVSGVLVDQVTPGSQAQDRGLVAGDVIVQVDNRPATTPDDVMSRLASRSTASGSRVALLVRNKSGARWIALFVGRIDVSGLLAPPVLPNGAASPHDATAGPR